MTRPMQERDLLELTPEQAEEIFAQGKEAVVWALLKLSVLAHERTGKRTLSTPSSQVPPYQKPPAKPSGKPRGRPEGHPGARRPEPERITRREEHRLATCPSCGGAVSDSYSQRKRVIEDIERSAPIITEHTLHTHYCPCCKKRFEAKVPDALPKSKIGHNALVLSAWQHYALGVTVSQVVEVLNAVFRFPVTGGGLCQQWHRLGDILWSWYDGIAYEALREAVLHADETGWRVNGRTHWLWCFANPTLTYYVIDRSRGSAVLEFLAECFEGVLVSDFYAAYNAVTAADRQLCLAHLLRELKETGARNLTEDWRLFHTRLKRLLQDAIRLAREGERETEVFANKRRRIHRRLDTLCEGAYTDADCQRIVKRLVKYRDGLFTFLDDPLVPFDNNLAEREIRPAVLARKNSYQNGSERGAETQAVLMTIFRTLKKRQCDPISTIVDALKTFVMTGELPQLPAAPPPREDESSGASP